MYSDIIFEKRQNVPLRQVIS